MTREELERIRLEAVRRVRAGEKASAVMESYGLCRTTIYPWLRREGAFGEEALKARKASGRPSRLDAQEKQQIAWALSGNRPRDHGYDADWWTRQLVSDLISELVGVRVTATSVTRLLEDLGIARQRPLHRIRENWLEGDRWVRDQYPALKRNARSRGADILFVTLVGVPPEFAWHPAWMTPVNAVLAMTPSGAFWYRQYYRTALSRLLREMARGHGRLLLVLDGIRYEDVSDLAAPPRGRIEVHCLAIGEGLPSTKR